MLARKLYVPCQHSSREICRYLHRMMYLSEETKEKWWPQGSGLWVRVQGMIGSTVGWSQQEQQSRSILEKCKAKPSYHIEQRMLGMGKRGNQETLVFHNTYELFMFQEKNTNIILYLSFYNHMQFYDILIAFAY